MNPHVSVITIGVGDMERAKRFYADGLGWPVEQDYPQWVLFKMGGGSSLLGLYPWEAMAADAGVASEGSGFRGVTFSYVVRTDDRVTEVLNEAERAGATIVKPAEAGPWGGCSGFFADTDGHLWKVASGGGPAPYAE